MSLSLRLRLFTIILVPLLLIATLAGIWRIHEARKTAEDLYDRNLVFTAVAVARDMALLDGDTISPETVILLNDAAGGPIRYHVYAPDGVFVTGYARPPIPIGAVPKSDQPFAHFNAQYQGKEVRVLRLWDVSQIAGLSGIFTITVWQDKSIREAFVQDLATRALTVIIALIATVAVVVWFGVNIGLKPLRELEDAISQRSPQDLTPIRRKVPPEARGIVHQLNRFIRQLQRSIEAQNNFITDAAHQLRNPIAGIQALSESIETAKSLPEAKKRAADLVKATRQASSLANRLLTLERIQTPERNITDTQIALNPLLTEIVQNYNMSKNDRDIKIILHPFETILRISGDIVMMREAISNLIDNALIHGGNNLSEILITLTREDGNAVILIADDGVGVIPSDFPKVLARFGQAQPGDGSGLGLPIAQAVAARLGGALKLLPQNQGFGVCMTLPLDQRPAA